MIIEINDSKTIGELTKEFSECFPFLKIEFFHEPHDWQEASYVNDMLPHNKKIAELRVTRQPAVMYIHSFQKTGTVEQEFKKILGLNVQVFRREGNAWVQTTDTDELTLEEQNKTAGNTRPDLLYNADIKLEKE